MSYLQPEEAVFMVQEHACPNNFHKEVLYWQEILFNAKSCYIRISKNYHGTLFLLPAGERVLCLYDCAHDMVKRILYHDDAPVFAYLSELVETDTKKTIRRNVRHHRRMSAQYRRYFAWLVKHCKKMGGTYHG